MQVRSLSLHNFRNYFSESVTFQPGITCILGNNGQGKTNLVESIYVMSSMASHRVSAFAPLINKTSEQSVIRIELNADSRNIALTFEINRSRANRMQVNGQSARMKEFPRYLSAVLFAPENLALIQGDPQGRRDFLDDLITHLNPAYAGTLSDFDRVHKQRNTLLKSLKTVRGSADTATLDVWNDKFVNLATSMTQARVKVISDLERRFIEIYGEIAQEDHSPRLELSYLGGSAEAFEAQKYTQSLSEALASNVNVEIERGITLTGPHRDDLTLVLNELPAKGSASHGETWSLVLALKLSAAELIRSQSTIGDPVIILDDVFSALDKKRREHLARAVQGFEQCIITTADLEDVPRGLEMTMMHIEGGKVVA